MKISTADKYFSLCIREAANHTCEWCGRTGIRMECSHVYSRRHRTIRWDAMNAVCKCNGCHKKWHESPLAAFAWFESEFGSGRVELLREKMRNRVKVSKMEEKEIAAHYRKELKKIEVKRASGDTGVIEFDSYQ
jgi:hypothetical protein